MECPNVDADMQLLMYGPASGSSGYVSMMLRPAITESPSTTSVPPEVAEK
jgi:hypothetical protein